MNTSYIVAIAAALPVLGYIATRLESNPLHDKGVYARRKRDELEAIDSRDVLDQIIQYGLKPSEYAALTVEQRIKQLRAGEYDIVKSILSSAWVVHNTALNCNAVTEQMYKAALKQANDMMIKYNSGEIILSDIDNEDDVNPTNLLYGIPISIKDQIDLRGHLSTCGLLAKSSERSYTTAPAIRLLLDQGAIPISRGNIPCLLMLPESDNRVWGRTTNPYNHNTTVGGSSGGDACLVATRAVPISIGADIGGSLRIPASFCGVFTLKPTPDRVSDSGLSEGHPTKYVGQRAIKAVMGPMTSSAEACVRVFRSWTSPHALAATHRPIIPFNHDLYKGRVSLREVYDKEHTLPEYSPNVDDFHLIKDGNDTHACNNDLYPTQNISNDMKDLLGTSNPLKYQGKSLNIGYFTDLSCVTVPPIAQATVQKCTAILRELGHTLIPVEPPGVDEAMTLYYRLLGADGGFKHYIECLDGEPMFPLYNQIYRASLVPNWLSPLLSTILYYSGEKRLSSVVNAIKTCTAKEHWDDVDKMVQYIDSFILYWKDLRLDAMICASNFTPAFTHGASKDMTPLFVYTYLWNILGFPAGTVPVTTVQSYDDVNYTNNPLYINDSASKVAYNSMKDSLGCPMGVQIISLPYADEIILRIMMQLEQVLYAESNRDKTQYPPQPANVKDIYWDHNITQDTNNTNDDDVKTTNHKPHDE